MYKYILSYDGGFLRDSADLGYVFETNSEALEGMWNAADEYMGQWKLEGSEYDEELFDYEIVEVLEWK